MTNHALLRKFVNALYCKTFVEHRIIEPTGYLRVFTNKVTFRLKTKKLYIIRHGQTDYNLNQRVQGRGIDSSLNTKGHEQAGQFFDAYQNVRFDKIYTSSLKRTRESVLGFIEKKYPCEALSGFDEISWGDHEGEPFSPEMHKRYLDAISSWSNGNLDMNVGGGESPLDVMARQQAAMNVVMGRSEEQTVLIATHGRAMRIMICWLLNYPLHMMDVFDHANCCVYLLEYTGSVYKILKNADTGHLD